MNLTSNGKISKNPKGPSWTFLVKHCACSLTSILWERLSRLHWKCCLIESIIKLKICRCTEKQWKYNFFNYIQWYKCVHCMLYLILYAKYQFNCLSQKMIIRLSLEKFARKWFQVLWVYHIHPGNNPVLALNNNVLRQILNPSFLVFRCNMIIQWN